MNGNKYEEKMDTFSMLINLALFIIAIIAWWQVNKLNSLVKENWSDPLAKNDAVSTANTARFLTFILWGIPLVFGAIAILSVLFRGNSEQKKMEERAALLNRRYGEQRAEAIQAARSYLATHRPLGRSY